MMPPYRLADLNQEQMGAIESLENELGITLVAYEPMCDAVRDSATQQLHEEALGDNPILDGIQDSYRIHGF